MLPDEAANFVSAVLADIPNRDMITAYVAFPNDMEMAVACSLAALRVGADGVKTCVFGKSCANTYPLSRILQMRGESYDFTCGLSSTELHRCAQQIEQIARVYTDDTSSSDVLAAVPEQETIMLDKNDDNVAVARAVRKLGYDLNPDDEASVYEAFIRLAEKKTVNARELEAIIASTALQVPPTYRLVSYLTTSGNVISASAHIQLEKDGKMLEGISVGDGPIDASFVAIEQIIGHHYELDDFQIQSVTEGHEAMGNALVRLRSGGKIYSGNGISTDIIGASIRAYLNALNKIVYEEDAEK
jgi:2-isopropylmalate synthase